MNSLHVIPADSCSYVLLMNLQTVLASLKPIIIKGKSITVWSSWWFLSSHVCFVCFSLDSSMGSIDCEYFFLFPVHPTNACIFSFYNNTVFRALLMRLPYTYCRQVLQLHAARTQSLLTVRRTVSRLDKSPLNKRVMAGHILFGHSV